MRGEQVGCCGDVHVELLRAVISTLACQLISGRLRPPSGAGRSLHADSGHEEAVVAFDLILRGGTIIDGTGSAAYAGDIGVEAGVISAIGDLSAAHAERELDVSDLVVAPGFIDCAHAQRSDLLPGARRFPPRR